MFINYCKVAAISGRGHLWVCTQQPPGLVGGVGNGSTQAWALERPQMAQGPGPVHSCSPWVSLLFLVSLQNGGWAGRLGYRFHPHPCTLLQDDDLAVGDGPCRGSRGPGAVRTAHGLPAQQAWAPGPRGQASASASGDRHANKPSGLKAHGHVHSFCWSMASLQGGAQMGGKMAINLLLGRRPGAGAGRAEGKLGGPQRLP